MGQKSGAGRRQQGREEKREGRMEGGGERVLYAFFGNGFSHNELDGSEE